MKKPDEIFFNIRSNVMLITAKYSINVSIPFRKRTAAVQKCSSGYGTVPVDLDV